MYSFIQESSNRKTGPIPVVYSARETCPSSCPHYRQDCYAEDFYTRMTWDKIPQRGIGLSELLQQIKSIKPGAFWRFNIGGDLPGVDEKIDWPTLKKIISANKGKLGFTYTHKKNPKYFDKYRQSINQGFIINLSADDAGEADTLADSGLPVTCIVPMDTPTKSFTPSGRLIAICPAQVKDTTCLDCQLCAKPNRAVIVGFRAHGTRKKITDAKARKVIPVVRA